MMIYFQRLMMYLINKKLKLLDMQIILKKNLKIREKILITTKQYFIVVIMIIMVKILIILN